MALSWPEVWASMTMSWRAFAEYHQSYDADDYYDALYGPRRWVDAETKDDRLDDICDAAKAKGIVVFTIRFEVTDHSADVMRIYAQSLLPRGGAGHRIRLCLDRQPDQPVETYPVGLCHE